MAVISQTTTSIGGGVAQIMWEALGSGDTGAPSSPLKTASAVACVQMTGTFGAAVVLEGSNDGVNWSTLKDLQGNDISMTAAGLVDFSTAARYVRPNAGAVSDVDVIMVVRT